VPRCLVASLPFKKAALITIIQATNKDHPVQPCYRIALV
jgi:hypothetical protein